MHVSGNKHHGAGADLDGAEKVEKITVENYSGEDAARRRVEKKYSGESTARRREKTITAAKPLPDGAGRITSTKSLQNSAEKMEKITAS